MRREHLRSLRLDMYGTSSQEEKDNIIETVFEYYYDRNDCQLEIALDEIAGDLWVLEQSEQYERCQILKDIIDRFE